MKKKNLEAGLASMIIVLIVALVVVVGGGIYFGTKKTTVEAPTDASVQADANVSGEQSNSLRGLFALGKNVMCTFNNVDTSGSSSGTVYISGNMMRGDFTMTNQSKVTSDSHMIRNGDVMYTWTGNQGAKMAFSSTQTDTSQGQQQANLDQKADYNCTSWTPDTSKFTVPTTVNFMDISTTMNSGAGAGVSAQCGACASLDATAKAQCLAALHC